VEKAFLPHRDLNASISIARRAMSSAGWRRGEPPEPENEAGGEKHQLNTGSLVL
jgi:transposase